MSNLLKGTIEDLENLLGDTLIKKKIDQDQKESFNDISIESPHFIAVITSNLGGNSPKQVKEQYDYIINQELYNKCNLNKQPLAYELLDKYIEQHNNNKIVIISEDTYLPSVTINTYSKFGNVGTVFISNNPKIVVETQGNNISYFGIDKDLLTDDLQFKLEENLTTYFTLQKIKQIGILKTCKTIKNMYSDKRIHLIIDLQIIDQTIAPSVKRSSSQRNFLSMGDINEIIHEFKDISYLDIIGFNESIDDSMFRYTKMTGEVCRTIIRDIFNIKEKSINIFTEDSIFLIYRPVDQISNDDIGWYIVRFMTLKERESFLYNLIDKVITITLDDIDLMNDLEVYVTSTSIKEQNKKSFYTANSIFDYCLFPEEKISMIFELLNSNEQSILGKDDKGIKRINR